MGASATVGGLCHAAERPVRWKAAGVEPDSFFIVTEFGVGIAGFSGIVVAISYRAGELEPLDRFRLLNVLSTALTAAFGGLVPQLLSAFGFAGGSLWRWSSIALAVFLAAVFIDPQVRRRRLSAIERTNVSRVLWVVVLGVLAVLAPLQLANAARAAPSPGPIFASLVGLLGISAILFIRVLLVRPRVPPDAWPIRQL